MNKALEPYVKLAPFLAVGLVVVAVAVGSMLFVQRGAKVGLNASIQKVRTLAIDDNSAAAIIDFRLQNPSDYPFVVRQVDVTLVDPSGKTLNGMVIAEVDAKRLFDYFPALGQKFNPSLIVRARIEAQQHVDRMLAVRFEIPEKLIEQRKNLTIRVEDTSGPVVQFSERPQK